MKKFTFITAIAFALVLTSCTADSEDVTYSKPEQVQQTQKFDSFDVYSREGDTIGEGDPIKPIKRD